MKLNKAQIGNLLLNIIGVILLIIFFVSFFIVVSPKIQSFFNVTLTLMWVFGVIFGFYYKPFLIHVAEPLTIKSILTIQKYSKKYKRDSIKWE